MNTPMSLRLDPELKKALEELAREEERSVSQVAVRAIRAYVRARREKTAAIAKAMKMADQGDFISAAAIHEWMRSWGAKEELPPPQPDVKRR